MRMNRLVTSVVTVALLGLAPAAVSTTASAAAPQAAPKVAESTYAAPDARAARTRKVTINAAPRGLVIQGVVKPRYARRVVIVQRGTCTDNGCMFKRYKKVRTNRSSRYRAQVAVPVAGEAVYRVMIPRSNGFAVSFSPAKKFYRV